jgi:hypothetical protein
MTDQAHPLAAFSRKYAPVFAVLCTAALILTWNNSGPTSVLVSGHQFVEGEAQIQAGPLRVDVNGRASIRISQPGPALSAAEVSDLSRYTLPSALADSTVSVTVHRGTALVVDAEGKRVALGPGESQSFPPAP